MYVYINIDHQEVIIYFIIQKKLVINSTIHNKKQHSLNINNNLLQFNTENQALEI